METKKAECNWIIFWSWKNNSFHSLRVRCTVRRSTFLVAIILKSIVTSVHVSVHSMDWCHCRLSLFELGVEKNSVERKCISIKMEIIIKMASKEQQQQQHQLQQRRKREDRNSESRRFCCCCCQWVERVCFSFSLSLSLFSLFLVIACFASPP